jgi:hypothetical protein
MGLVPPVDVDIPGVPNDEVCISRCEVEWFIIAGGNAKGSFVPRDVKHLSASRHVTDKCTRADCALLAQFKGKFDSLQQAESFDFIDFASQYITFNAVRITPR